MTTIDIVTEIDGQIERYFCHVSNPELFLRQLAAGRRKLIYVTDVNNRPAVISASIIAFTQVKP